VETVRIGMILPSSNTVVEPVTIAVTATLPGVSAHFARFRLTEVTVDDPAAAYYRSGALAGAARLLADARCDVICWNGSAGGVVGFDLDRELCRGIERETGIPATTSSLAILDAFTRASIKRFAMVTLNPPAMNATIARHFAAEGFECVASTPRTDMADNFAMATVPPDEIAVMACDCARVPADATLVYGTNTRGAPVAAALETQLARPVYDSVLMGIHGALRRAGVPTTPLAAWGSVFQT
jgi:maleate isomerase